MASRMESHGVPSQVQMSKATYNLLGEDLGYTSRGEIKIKGGEMMETYLSPAYLLEEDGVSHTDSPSEAIGTYRAKSILPKPELK